MAHTTNTLKNKTANFWLKDIVEQVGGNTEKVPSGWLTMREIMESEGMSLGKTETMMEKAIKAGIVVKKKFRVVTGVGVKPVWHYIKKELAKKL
jgi:hypothetical protein